MGAWYYLVKGRPFGPVAASTIEGEIKAGRLHAHDLIYKAHDTIWREIKGIAEFAHLFKEKPQEPGAPEQPLRPSGGSAGLVENHWVLLIRKPDGSGYKQKGPYLSSEIANMLKKNEIGQTDYVWRDGLKEWYKILAVGEIQDLLAGRSAQPPAELPPVPEAPVVPPPLSETTRKNVAVKIVQQGEKAAAPPDKTEVIAKPVEQFDLETQVIAPAQAKELLDASKVPARETKERHDEPRTRQPERRQQHEEPRERRAPDSPTHDPDTAVVREVRTPSRRRRSNPEASGHRLSIFRYFLELTPVNKIIFMICSSGIVASLLFVIFWYSSYQDRFNGTLRPPNLTEIPPIPPSVPPPHQVQQPVTPQAPPAQPVAPAVKAIEPAPVAPAPVVVSEVKHAPSYIQIEKLANGTENSQLRLLSDASAQFNFVVTFESILGEVLDLPSVYIRRTVSGAGNRIVDFRKQNLPYGEYRVTVESDKAKATTIAEFGTITKDFHKLLHAHRKRLSFDHNEERFGFLKTVFRLERETYKFAQGIDAAGELRSWTEFYRAWRKDFDRIHNSTMTAITARNRQKYVHANLWLQLKEVHASIDKEARQINQARLQKRPTSSAQAHSLATNLTQMKDQMIAASLWH